MKEILMKLNSNQTETIMYESRLLCEHEDIETAAQRALAFTIKVKHLSNTTHVQKAIFEKVHRAIYGTISKPDEFTFSMLIAGDVESSRDGFLSKRDLQDPLYPHYHGLIIFSKKDWAAISIDLSNCIAAIRNLVLRITEVEETEIDEDGCYINETVWIKKFEPKPLNIRQYNSELATYIQYVIKADLLANKQSISTYQPMVFPYDRHGSETTYKKSDELFKRLAQQQMLPQSQWMQANSTKKYDGKSLLV